MGDAKTISLADARLRVTDPFWRQGTKVDPSAHSDILFADLAQAFLAEKEKAGLRSQSPRIYLRSQLIPAFGHVPAASLTTDLLP